MAGYKWDTNQLKEENWLHGGRVNVLLVTSHVVVLISYYSVIDTYET
jgi:hypothetical protein